MTTLPLTRRVVVPFHSAILLAERAPRAYILRMADILDTFTIRAVAAQHRVDYRTLARAASEGLGVIRGEVVRERVARALDDLAKTLAERSKGVPTEGRRA